MTCVLMCCAPKEQAKELRLAPREQGSGLPQLLNSSRICRGFSTPQDVAGPISPLSTKTVLKTLCGTGAMF